MPLPSNGPYMQTTLSGQGHRSTNGPIQGQRITNGPVLGLPRNGYIPGSRPVPAGTPRQGAPQTQSPGGRYIKNGAKNGPRVSPSSRTSATIPKASASNLANAQWPESYGFSLAGEGPVYVISVQRESVAHRAGLVPGDQLLEVDGHNVTSMSLDAVCTLARHSKQIPPTIGVVSRIQYAELIASRRHGYGMTLRGVRPTTVEAVDPKGPAYHAGIRPGDLILEINGRKIRDLTLLRPVLNSHHGRVTLAVVPVDAKTPSHHGPLGGAQIRTTEASRLRKAKHLFAKMNEVLQGDYEKKMAVVGLLKQYAEDRQVDTFAGGLNFVLRTPEHRQLIKDVRPFIPVKHRQRFDAILQYDPLVPTSLLNQAAHASNFSSMTPHQLAAARQGSIREVQIVREKGSFGFVLRGHNPVYVETVNPGGPAEKAGMLPGDALLKLNGLDIRHSTHSHVVKLLQGSGSKPKLQVQQLLDENGVPMLFDGSTTENSSSASSASGSDWPPDDGPYSHMVDRGGRTFRQRVDHLLTSSEKAAFRRALLNYSANRNASQLVDDLNIILDTPSKKTLWGFILPRMAPEHREYVIKYIDLPKHDIQEYLSGRMAPDSRDATLERSAYHRKDEPEPTTSHSIDIHGSFRYQLDYLLTSKERSQLKKTLQIYADKRNVQNLIEDLGEILDTPSKKTLWFYIIPLLSPHHQTYCQRQLGLPPHIVKSEQDRSAKADGFFTPDGRLVHQRKGEGHFRVGELEDWADDEDDSTDGDYRLHTPAWPDRHTENNAPIIQPWDGEQSTVTLKPSFVDGTGREKSTGRMKESSVQTTPRNSLRTSDYKTVIRVYDNPGLTADIVEMKNRHSVTAKDYDVHYNVNGEDRQGDGQSIASSHPDGGKFSPIASKFSPVVRKQIVRNANKLSTDDASDVESEGSVKNSITSLDSFQAKAMKAIRALDDVVANEPSDFESASILNFNYPQGQDKVIPGTTSQNKAEQIPAPIGAPPPPPAPPPLPPGLTSGLPGGKLSNNSNTSMRVKRMNWEKIDKIEENTVWAKLKDQEDLEDVVKYLELEQQFSTKKNKLSESFRNGKSEVSILAPKKAYNISILLGHLKKSVGELQQSLLRTDEAVLTQELLRQILAYAPDENENRQYDEYKGPLDQLSKPDQFMYQLRQVPGYKERMKAMLFKANFSEKVEEVKNNLEAIKLASNELQNSKKLANILELVLAMGNYMNKGNTRVGEAQAFRISVLAQLDLTKTADNKGTFLNVLADAVQNKYPASLPLSKDLPHINNAAKVSMDDIAQEIEGLRKMLEDIKAMVNHLKGLTRNSSPMQDRFQDIMAYFLTQADGEITLLQSQQHSTGSAFSAVAQYFGEDPTQDNSEIFTVFADFVTKLERAHQQNMLSRKK